MKRFSSSITQRGQVTLPAEVRRLLGVRPRDKVEFVLEDGRVTVVRPEFTLQTVFGSVKPWWAPEDIDQEIREAKEEHRDERLRRKKQRS